MNSIFRGSLFTENESDVSVDGLISELTIIEDLNNNEINRQEGGNTVANFTGGATDALEQELLKLYEDAQKVRQQMNSSQMISNQTMQGGNIPSFDVNINVSETDDFMMYGGEGESDAPKKKRGKPQGLIPFFEFIKLVKALNLPEFAGKRPTEIMKIAKGYINKAKERLGVGADPIKVGKEAFGMFKAERKL